MYEKEYIFCSLLTFGFSCDKLYGLDVANFELNHNIELGGIVMKQTRMLGNYVYQKALEKGLSIGDLSNAIGCEEHHMKAFVKGRLLLSYQKLSELAQFIKIDLKDLVNGDEETYNRTVVHCMSGLDKVEHREEILDIIDIYLDIKNSVN